MLLGYDTSSNMANCKWYNFYYLSCEDMINRCMYVPSMEYYAAHKAVAQTLHNYFSKPSYQGLKHLCIFINVSVIM